MRFPPIRFFYRFKKGLAKGPRGWLPWFPIILLSACLSGEGVQKRFTTEDKNIDGGMDYYDTSYLRYKDHVYKKDIRSVRFHQKGWEQGDPVIKKGKKERLVLSFDDMDGDSKDYRYRFIHCNANWKPSELQKNQYLQGYYEDRIVNDRFSFDTQHSYTHYQLEVPNEQIGITRSGNYLLYVFRDTGTIEPIITRRFMVVASQTVKVKGSIGRPTKMDRYDSGQQLRFKIRYPDRDIPNPMRSLSVVVQQNSRWDNAVYDPPVSAIRKNEIVMGEQGDATIFDALNEFRAFDTKFLSGNAQQVRAVERDSNNNEHVHLKIDQVRGSKGYYSEKDINGHSLIRVREASDPALSAEYVRVHFTLERDAPLQKGPVYIFGEISDYRCLPRFQMEYDREAGAYRKSLLLKQGYHEYLYAYLPDRKGHARFGPLEGNFFETENAYRILVYYQGQTDRADRLIGMKRFNSRKDKDKIRPGR
ncbi:MAG: DUF5103 domain-containing protein [Flavobacteriales bacterium]